MRRRLVFRPLAEADLESIRRFIAADSPRAGVRLVDLIEKRCISLLDFTEQGRARDDLSVGLRILPFGRSVVIAYRFDSESVEIMRVWHGGQNYEALFET